MADTKHDEVIRVTMQFDTAEAVRDAAKTTREVNKKIKQEAARPGSQPVAGPPGTGSRDLRGTTNAAFQQARMLTGYNTHIGRILTAMNRMTRSVTGSDFYGRGASRGAQRVSQKVMETEQETQRQKRLADRKQIRFFDAAISAASEQGRPGIVQSLLQARSKLVPGTANNAVNATQALASIAKSSPVARMRGFMAKRGMAGLTRLFSGGARLAGAGGASGTAAMAGTAGMAAVSAVAGPVAIAAIVAAAVVGAAAMALDTVITKLSKYNPVLYGRERQYERVQRMFGIGAAQKLQGVGQAWYGLKTQVLEDLYKSLNLLTPILSRLVTVINLYTSGTSKIGKLIDLFTIFVGYQTNNPKMMLEGYNSYKGRDLLETRAAAWNEAFIKSMGKVQPGSDANGFRPSLGQVPGQVGRGVAPDAPTSMPTPAQANFNFSPKYDYKFEIQDRQAVQSAIEQVRNTLMRVLNNVRDETLLQASILDGRNLAGMM